MPYMLLIIEPVGQREARGVDAGKVVYERMQDFSADLQQRGILLNSASLASTDDGAMRLQRRDGRHAVVDGPFAEAKEMIGGFFLLAVETREEALAIAARCPAAEWATVEVRRTGPCYASLEK